MDLVRLLFSFDGRVDRARYIVVWLALAALWPIAWFNFPFHFAARWEILYWIAAIPMVWISAAITVKRLHDRDRSGWWAVAVLTLGALSFHNKRLFFGTGLGASGPPDNDFLFMCLAIALTPLKLWAAIEVIFLIGTDGPNRFGPGPTRRPPPAPVDPRPESGSVPDFLVRRAGRPPRH